ncbi:MAG TPA: dTDP-4-dehydrorhamnose reductase [Polyangia bacterium]|nr:dTDP-4-dehydrorhamnose reductase [Polyangia bacterium]
MAVERKAIVLGARGTLGLALCEELPRAGWSVAAAVARDECDIRDEAALRALFDRHRPAAVFNAAAYTDVDRAEIEPEVAFAVNEAGARSVARASAAVGVAVVHYSTDFVFDGEKPLPYDESDPPSPQGSYARSKVAGDAAVAEGAARHFILRVGCLYGRSGRNFPSTIVRRLRKGETVRADGERLGSPTWVREVARVSAALAATESYGLYHCTSQGETTWAAFASLAAEILGVPATKVEAVPTAALPMKASRPRRAILDNRRLREIGLDSLSTWQDALRAFAAEEMRLE